MATTIAPVATIQLPHASRVLKSSWCPDKDLLLVISRVAHLEKITLYKMQGAKKWELTIAPDAGRAEAEVVDVAWSPDVQSFAIVLNPPSVTIHSIQNGKTLNTPISFEGRRELKAAWWFREQKQVVGNGIPDIFKRGENITGSAHSILKSLPLLDPIQDDTKPLGSSELFAFQAGRGRAVQQPALPNSIVTWPCLPLDLSISSIAANKPDAQGAVPEVEDEEDDTNMNSILAVADNLGFVHLFLEGSYPLGAVSVHSKGFPRSLYKFREHFFSHIGPSTPSPSADAAVGVQPHVMKLPYLAGRHYRDVARVSTSARELLAYAMRVVKDMRAAWFGTDTQVGARDLGPKWVQALEARQANEFGQEDPYALLDLTCLLTTGRSSEGLMDFLGSGEHMSDRSIQKWETIMGDALLRLRDLSEKRVAPACQRLLLLLQEVQGWAALPQYAVCHFNPADVEFCLELTGSAIFQASWLASTARKELLRFKEFMKWIRYETAKANATGDQHAPRPQHDILEVNDYLTSSLVVSPIDKWFVGPVSSISRASLGVPSEDADLGRAIDEARAALDHWDQTVHEEVKPRDLSHVERNLDTVLQTLAGKCQQMFEVAGKAAARSAEVVAGYEADGPAPAPAATASPVDEVQEGPQSAGGPPSSAAPLIRERTVAEEGKPGEFLQYLAIRPPRETSAGAGGRQYLCLVRLRQGLGALRGVPAVEVSVLECCCASGTEEGGSERFDLLDVEFFDSEMVVIVYRRGEDQESCIATVGYANLIYHTIPSHEYVNGATRERLMGDVLERVANGQVPSVPTPIVQSRTLSGFSTGGVTLVVNGRVGRRVSCVVDEAGLRLEVLDMEGEDEDEGEDISGEEAG